MIEIVIDSVTFSGSRTFPDTPKGNRDSVKWLKLIKRLHDYNTTEWQFKKLTRKNWLPKGVKTTTYYKRYRKQGYKGLRTDIDTNLKVTISHV